jgi:hypothetical protein
MDRTAAFELHHIVATFVGAVAARLLPFESDDLLAFDCSALAGPKKHEGHWGENYSYFLDEWRRVGTCPAPGFYDVLHSTWARELMLDSEDQLKHLVAFSRGTFVEVLASAWCWKPVEKIRDAPPPLGPDGIAVMEH